jgi:hypothetical protein
LAGVYLITTFHKPMDVLSFHRQGNAILPLQPSAHVRDNGSAGQFMEFFEVFEADAIEVRSHPQGRSLFGAGGDLFEDFTPSGHGSIISRVRDVRSDFTRHNSGAVGSFNRFIHVHEIRNRVIGFCSLEFR